MFRLIYLLFLLCSCEQNDLKEPFFELSIPVLAESPSISDIVLTFELIGTLRPSVSVDIYAQSEGILQQVFVHEGEWIKAGTPLFQIDSQLHILKMQEAEAQISIDKASLCAIERKLIRFSRLNDKGLVAESEWDKHETEKAKTAGKVDLALAKLKLIARDLEKCTIHAPIDGRIGKIEASPGHLITKTSPPLATILQMDPLVVEFSITEKEYELMQGQNKPIEIYPLNKSKGVFRGNITFIDNHFDVKTGQILVRGIIPNSNHELRPGQLVDVKVPFDIRKNAIIVPHKAVKRKAEGAYVYLIDLDKKAIMRSVMLGEELGENVIIKEGVEADDQVITEGHLRLHTGVTVKIQ